MKPTWKTIPASAFVILMSAFAFSAAAQNPGHPPSQIGPGTFAGSGTWTFPGNIVASGTICGSAGCAGSGGTGGTCACPWTAQNPPGLFYSGGAGVSGDLWANRICENGGTSCISIDAIGSGNSYWSAATLQGVSGISYNSYIGAAKYCDTGGTTCKSITEMGGTGTCTCPSIWTEPAAGRTYYMGNVGVGTSGPTAALHVTGTTYDETPSVAGTQIAAGAIELTRTGEYPYIDFQNDVDDIDSDYDARIILSGDNTLGVAGAAFLVSGNVGASQYCDQNGANCHLMSELVNVPAATSPWLASGTSIYYNGGGGVGIGKTPVSGVELDVSGDVRAQQLCDENGANCKDLSAGWSVSPWSVTGDNIYVSITKNVGIGVETPAAPLDIESEYSTSDNSPPPAIRMQHSFQSEDWGMAVAYYGDLVFTSNEGSQVRFIEDGSIRASSIGVNKAPLPGTARVDVEGGSATMAIRGQTNGGASGVGVYGYSAGTGVQGRGNVRGVSGDGGTYDFYASGSGTNYGPFTGAHEAVLSGDFPENPLPGMIVSVTGEVKERFNDGGDLTISSTLPTVRLSDTSNDASVFGALVSESGLPEDHWYEPKAGERFGIVNALGEGRVLVTDINGDVKAGDYITTSRIPGYGMRQDDDLLHSFTLGKATEDVEWGKVAGKVEYAGKKYKAYLIAVVYTSG